MTLPQSAAVASISSRATLPIHHGSMTKADMGKARWARAQAASLWRQADELDGNLDGDWRARAGRRRGADHLRAEAAKFDRLANRLQPLDEEQAA